MEWVLMLLGLCVIGLVAVVVRRPTPTPTRIPSDDAGWQKIADDWRETADKWHGVALQWEDTAKRLEKIVEDMKSARQG